MSEQNIYTREQAILIEKWFRNDTFIQTLSVVEIEQLKRIRASTSNLLRDDTYWFVYGNMDRELLNNIRQRWITFKRIHENS